MPIMSQDYNINMKQYNGSDYDNILPLAYNSLRAEHAVDSGQLQGKSYQQVYDIIYNASNNYATERDLLLSVGHYTGNGTYGEENPVIITFPFEPVVFFFPSGTENQIYPVDGRILWEELSTSWKRINNLNGPTASELYPYVKCSSDRKSIYMYDAEDAINQFNSSNLTYYFFAIGGYTVGAKLGGEWIFTTSTTWTVPYTGKYYLELYGAGGAGAGSYNSNYTGGSSGNKWDEISLTAGDSISITVGHYNSFSRAGSTTFGSYTVAGRGNATTSSIGKGSGNMGKDGIHYTNSTGSVNKITENILQRYGTGGKYGNTYSGTSGAAFIKYLA